MKFIIFISLFVFANVLFAQVELPRIKNYTPKDYGKFQTPENWCIEEGSDGTMYFGNAAAVLSFDGEDWATHNFTEGKVVRSLFYDSSTDLLFAASENEFGFYKKEENNELSYRSLFESLPEEVNGKAKEFGTFWTILGDSENIYFQSDLVWITFNKSTEEITINWAETSYHLAFKLNDEFYIREREKGLLKWEGTSFKALPDAFLFSDFGVFDLINLKDKQLIVTSEIGYYYLTKDSIYPANFDTLNALSNRLIIGGKKLKNGCVFNSLSEGLIFTNLNGEETLNIDTRNGLKSKSIKATFEDSHGNLWAASDNGISVLEFSTGLSVFNENCGLEGNVNCFYRDNNLFLVGTSIGLFEWTDNQFTKLDLHFSVWDIKTYNDEILVGADQGLFRYENGTLSLIVSINAQNIFIDTANQFLHCSNDRGIFIFDLINRFSLISTEELNLGRALGISQDPKTGLIWYGSSTGTVASSEFDGFEHQFNIYFEKDGLRAEDWIRPINLGKELIFGTTSEVLRFVSGKEVTEEADNGTEYTGYFSEHPTFSGLNFELIVQAKERDQSLWVCQSNEIEEYSTSNYTLNASPFASIDHGRINFLDVDNTLTVGSAEGLAILTPSKSTDSVNLKLNSFRFGDSVLWNKSILNNEGIIPFKLNDLEVSLSINTKYIDGSTNEYRFKLNSKEWSHWSNSNKLMFPNLDFGENTIELQGKNSAENISNSLKITFTIDHPWYAKTWAIILYAICLAFLIWAAVLLGRRRLKKQNAKLEVIVKERTHEIEEKNTELKERHDEIQEQKQEIVDSINYAQRIQQAILPVNEDMAKNLTDYFVLFMPKDVVSGDFYWFAQHLNKKIFVCADCTGHGVPGAFMSMIGADKLNRAVLEEGHTSPGRILEELNVGIKQSLKQNDDEDVSDSTKDGMDAAIVVIEENKLYYSGANNPLWIVRNNELLEYKATKKAVAGFTPNDQVFDVHEIELQKDDLLYMTTDGYPDQFGGPRDKKLKLKTMKALLLENNHKSLAEQHNILKAYIIDWMGDTEQIDDICVVGIRI